MPQTKKKAERKPRPVKSPQDLKNLLSCQKRKESKDRAKGGESRGASKENQARGSTEPRILKKRFRGY